MANHIMRGGKRRTIDLVLTDRFGNPAAVDGTPTWETTDPAICAVEPNAGGMGAVVRALGRTGSAEIRVTVDADMGDGVRHMVGAAGFDVLAGEVSVMALMVGEEVDDPAPAPQPAEPEPAPEPAPAPEEPAEPMTDEPPPAP